MKKYIITLIVGAVLSVLSYAADNREFSLPFLSEADAADVSVVEVPLLAVVVPPEPDDANIVSEGPELPAGAYKDCPGVRRDCPGVKRDCEQRWSCRGPVRRVVFVPLRRLLGRKCH